MTISFLASMLKPETKLSIKDAVTGKVYRETTAQRMVNDNLQDRVKDWDLNKKTIYI